MIDKLDVKSTIITTTVLDSVTIKQLFFTWLRIGFTSFGGGAVTTYLMQEYFIYRHKWITEEEYGRMLAMCQITPGMNNIAITVLIGRRLGGGLGILASLTGLVLPSVGITIGMAIIYTNISQFTRAQTALRAIFAAIFGIALVTNWRNVKPIIVRNYQRGPLALSAAMGIMIGSAMLYVFFNPPVIVLYLLGGLCGALTYWHIAKRVRED